MKRTIEELTSVKAARDIQNETALIPKGTIGIVVDVYKGVEDVVMVDFLDCNNVPKGMDPEDFILNVERDRDFEIIEYYDPIAECMVPADEYESPSYVSKPKEKGGKT